MGYTAFVTSIGDAILEWADPIAAGESRYTEVRTKNIFRCPRRQWSGI